MNAFALNLKSEKLASGDVKIFLQKLTGIVVYIHTLLYKVGVEISQKCDVLAQF
jgi:hypothetical protein